MSTKKNRVGAGTPSAADSTIAGRDDRINSIADSATQSVAPNSASDFLARMFGPVTELPLYICSFPNERDDPSQAPERHVSTRLPSHINSFIAKWDKPERGLFFCTGIVKRGEKRNKDNIVQTVGLHADVDFKNLDGDPDRAEVLRQIERLQHQPSMIVFSGGGLHLYFLLTEAIDTPKHLQRIETALRALADLVGGDRQVCEVSRVMRLVGTHNTKAGAWTEVVVLSDTGLRYELDDLEEWLSEAQPVLRRKVEPKDDGHPKCASTHNLPRDRDDDAEPIDRDKLLAALAVISSECSYEVWRNVAAALHFELGEAGREIFIQWSSSSPQYNEHKCKAKWRGVKTMTQYTGSTILFLADEADPTWRERYDEKIHDDLAAGFADVKAGQRSNDNVITKSDAAEQPGGITADDFYAYMPDHSYIFVPTRETWPASSVNSRLPRMPLVKADGTPMRDRSSKLKYVKPSLWLDTQRPVEQMTWCPGLPLTVDGRLMAEGGWVERSGVTTFNLYRPPTVSLGNSANADRWIDLVQRIYPEDAEHIITFCAHRIQHPDVKINHGLILGGSPGIGKDSMLEPLKLGVGPWNFREISPQDIMSHYNDYMRCVVLRISEAHDLGDVNRFSFHDHMKVILATPPDVIRVNGKYIPQHYVMNVAGVIYTTNHRFDGLYLPADDRRSYVCWTEVKAEDFTNGFWPGLWDWYKIGGLADIVAYLSEYDLSKFDPKAPPRKTEAFWQIVGAGAAPEASELADALDALGAKVNARDTDDQPCGPVVTTLAKVLAEVSGDLFEWLKDRKNRRVIPHKFEACGYTPLRNNDAKDRLWVIGGHRQVVYGRLGVPLEERIKAANSLK